MKSVINPELPPPVQMLNFITGYWVSQLILVVAKLDIAELIKEGPKTAPELAAQTGTNAAALSRILRALTSIGVFTQDSHGKLSLTALGATLKKDEPMSMRNFALMMIEGYNWQSWQELEYSVKTGAVALEKVFNQKIFEYLENHPEDARVFGESMSSLSATENPAIARAYDFSPFGTLIDIGGGHGSLISAILNQFPSLRGVLFDSPQVIQNARNHPYIQNKEISGRINVVEGNFFDQVPAGGNAYIMKYIMHDWNDELAGKILDNVRKVIPQDGKLLIVDTVIPQGNDPHWGKMLDVNMLVLTGGKERTEEEFRTLLRSSGFQLVRVIPTACPLSIIEGQPT